MLTERKLSLLDFSYLPEFARFVLTNHLDEFVQEQIQLSRQINLSMLRYFEALPEAQFQALARQGATEFLTYFIENRAEEQIETALRQWLSDSLPMVGRNQIVAEDITQVSFVRKQAFLKLLPAYTSDVQKALRIVGELDVFTLETETRSTNSYINLLNSKLQESEQTLREGIELYKQSQALTHIGNWRWYITENYVRWSDEMFRVYGLEPQCERVTYERFLERVHPEDRDRVQTYIQNALQTGQPLEYVHRVILPDGQVRYVQAKGEVLLDENGVAVEMIGTGQDITARQLASLEIEEKQTFIQKLTDAAPSIIASYNINTGQYVFINQAVEKLLGYAPEQILSAGVMFLLQLVHPEDLRPMQEANEKALAAAHQTVDGHYVDPIEEFRYRMRHQNGEYRWFETYGTVFDRNPDGTVAHILNITLDITDKVEAERKIAEKTLQIEQSNTSLREFAYIASHDLKEPLRKISTFGDRLRAMEQDRLSEEGKVILDKMISSSGRMQSMISDVLSVSLISADKAFEMASLQVILDDVILALDLQPEQRVLVENGPLPKAWINPRQFRQLFMNLLNNSLKFVRDGVPPVIRISHRLRLPEEVEGQALMAAARYHELTFADNGIGFDNRFAGRIFALFERLHGKSEFEGTGIGLAVCRRILENHGGLIQASGVVNQGATFVLLFPDLHP
ncbi:sensor histidine kinase [Tellurirhabdus rosea]|uniref:sensor histidine kinase n=1 Tax=Tellurirhabdus rosea TaxID=2674997 RepID=UPI00225586C9|nr:PAS domain-containing protein [Tellurirhabdus rosea]